MKKINIAWRRISITNSLLIVLIYSIGCNNVSELDYPLVYEGDRVIILSQLQNDQEIFVQLYSTSPPLDSFVLDSFYIRNAEVRLFENDTFYDLVHLSNGLYGTQQHLEAKSGSSYKIEVKAPGFPDAFSDLEIVPFSGAILNADWMDIESTNQYDGVLRFDLQIPANAAFEIVISGIAGSESTSPEYDITQGLGLFCQNIVLVPECFTEDGHVEIEVNTEYLRNQVPIVNTHLGILLNILSPSRKAYIESNALLQDAFDYPFIGNSSPYTNIHNGYGLLSSSAESFVLLPVQ